jgi:uncharacterized membrane protein
MTSSADPLNPQPRIARFRGWFAPLLISLLVSLLIAAPSFWRGDATGHDFQFHASSWMDAAGQWKEGIVFPRWTEWANYGYGEPRFIFYPPISWMLGAALGSVFPWSAVPTLFLVLAQTLAGLCAYFLARRMLSKRAALFCTACYAANPYALLNIYMRSDFAELISNALLPLLLLLAFQLCELLENAAPYRERPAPWKIASFALVFAASWLANAPAGVITSYSAAAVFGLAAIMERSWRPVLRGTAGLALGFGLAAFYLLPAAYEQRWVNIAQALSTGLLPSENFLFTVVNDPEHTLFNWIASSIAVALLMLTGLAAIAARRRENSNGPVLGERLWRILLLLAALAGVLMFRFTSILWNVLPKLRYVQFPWRWMSLLAVPFALFLGAAMARKRWGWIWALAAIAFISGTGVVLVQQGWWDTQDIPVLREAIANGGGFDGTDEYDPIGDDHTNIPPKSDEAVVMDTDSMPGPVTKPEVHVDRWRPEEKEVSVSSRKPFFLGLRLLNYPAWRVEVNGALVKTQSGEDFNQMIVAMPAGKSRVRVLFARTWDRTLGGIVSLCSALIAAWVLFRGKSS